MDIVKEIEDTHFDILEYANNYYNLSKHIKCKIDTSTRRVRHWYKGDKVTCSYAVKRMKEDIAEKVFLEYSSISEIPEIGSFSFTDNSMVIKAVVCHEIAHGFTDFIHGYDVAPHGTEWQSIYAPLRTEFVNDFVTPISFKEKKEITSVIRENKFQDSKSDFSKYAPKWLNLNDDFILNNTTYTVIGWYTRGRKYKVFGQDKVTGERYKFILSDVQRGLINV